MFIELHPHDSEHPLLIAVSKIVRIVPDNEGTLVHYSGANDPHLYVRESYKDVASKLSSAGAKVIMARPPMQISAEMLEKAQHCS